MFPQSRTNIRLRYWPRKTISNEHYLPVTLVHGDLKASNVLVMPSNHNTDAPFLTANFDMLIERAYRLQELQKSSRRTTLVFLSLMSAEACDALIGDLQESFVLNCERLGAGRAKRRYWSQVITSLAPIIWAATKRLTKTLTGVAALVELYRKIRF